MSILWKKQCEMQMMIADSVDFEIFVLYVWRTFFTLCNVSDVGHWWLLT